jgi:hypothetical protein
MLFMKGFTLTLATVLLFAVASFAQNTPDQNPGASPGTQSSSPAMHQDNTQSGQSGSMGNAGTATTGEKKLKGCVVQEGGQYALQDKHGKTVQLSGQDLSAHVGHTVAVHGMYQNTSEPGSATSSSNASGASGSTSATQVFTVSSVDMISDSCNGGKKSNSSNNPGMSPNDTGSVPQTQQPKY